MGGIAREKSGIVRAGMMIGWASIVKLVNCICTNLVLRLQVWCAVCDAILSCELFERTMRFVAWEPSGQ